MREKSFQKKNMIVEINDLFLNVTSLLMIRSQLYKDAITLNTVINVMLSICQSSNKNVLLMDDDAAVFKR